MGILLKYLMLKLLLKYILYDFNEFQAQAY
jgi:hypothetical protein